MVSQYSGEKEMKNKRKKMEGREKNPTLKLQVFPGRKTLKSEAIIRNNIGRSGGYIAQG